MTDWKKRIVVATISCLPWFALLGWLSRISWFLTDDAFISFRYTRNLLEGHGLVFNVGERVEGYTNFLWILELAAIWGIFGVRPEQAAPWLSVAFTAATIAAVLWWVTRLPHLDSRSLVAWMSLGLLCSSATFAVWTSGGGLETRQFTFFIVAAVVCLSLYASSPRGLLTSSFCLAAAELTRPEGLLLAACCFAWFALKRLITEKRVSAKLLRQLLYLVAPFALLVAAHFLFRYAYYGEWLPNTYYAKHIRPWYESGFRYLWAAALETGLYVLLPLAYLAMRVRWQTLRDGIHGLVLLCVVAHMVYILPIGGDHFEYRLLDFYWPLLALPAAEAIAILGTRISAILRRLPQVSGWAGARLCCTTAIFLPILFYSNVIQGVILVEGTKHRFVHIHLGNENTRWLLTAPGMPALVAISNDMRRLVSLNGIALRFGLHRDRADFHINHWRKYEEMERGFIPGDVLMADSGMGKFYFVPDLKVIDNHGLTDATVARTPVTKGNDQRFVAHDRHPSPEYLMERGVNFEMFPVVSSADDALDSADFAVKFGPDLWMPFNTVNAHWANQHFPNRDLRAFAPNLEPLTVKYDGGIALLGIALGHGNRQLPSSTPLALDNERSLRCTMRWLIEPELDIDYAISLRLYNAEGKMAFQSDDPLRHPVMFSTTTYWLSSAPVDTLFRLKFPADLPPGDYELRMVVYDQKTKVPTVVIDVWEPETTLAYLRLAEAN